MTTNRVITVDIEKLETGGYKVHSTLPLHSDIALMSVAAIAEQLLAKGVVSLMALHMAIDRGAEKLERKLDTIEGEL